jgi:hypothetical protein
MTKLEPEAIWQALQRKLVVGGWSESDVRPLMPGMLSMLVTMLNRWSSPRQADLQLYKIVQVGQTIHFLLRRDKPDEKFCVSVQVEGDHWYMQHLESINIDFSEPSDTPCVAEDLPSLPEAQVAWIREEVAMTERVRLFAFLCASKTRQFALDWFKDGDGYALAARAWIPYFAPEVALVWYAAWSEWYLHRNPACIKMVGPQKATLCLTDPLHWHLYRQTGHLRSQISEADYEALFDVIWQDRARAAGWRLGILRAETSIDLCFTRS